MGIIPLFPQTNESNYTCVFWETSENGGTWSPRGCSVVQTNPEYTVCACNHLSSFAVLMAVYEMEVENQHNETNHSILLAHSS